MSRWPQTAPAGHAIVLRGSADALVRQFTSFFARMRASALPGGPGRGQGARPAAAEQRREALKAHGIAVSSPAQLDQAPADRECILVGGRASALARRALKAQARPCPMCRKRWD